MRLRLVGSTQLSSVREGTTERKYGHVIVRLGGNH
jgi:hypothetical protein